MDQRVRLLEDVRLLGEIARFVARTVTVAIRTSVLARSAIGRYTRPTPIELPIPW